jgi:hypothetical protein
LNPPVPMHCDFLLLVELGFELSVSRLLGR